MGDARRKMLAGNTEPNKKYKKKKRSGVTKREINNMIGAIATNPIAFLTSMTMMSRQRKKNIPQTEEIDRLES